MSKPIEVNDEFLGTLLESCYTGEGAGLSGYRPRGLFYKKGETVWVACDNSTGDAWVEEFKTEEKAIKWLEASDE
jgi:hypothetical protein